MISAAIALVGNWRLLAGVFRELSKNGSCQRDKTEARPPRNGLPCDDVAPDLGTEPTPVNTMFVRMSFPTT